MQTTTAAADADAATTAEAVAADNHTAKEMCIRDRSRAEAIFRRSILGKGQ